MIVIAALLLAFQEGPVATAPQPAPEAAPVLAPSAASPVPAADTEPPPPVQLVPPPPPLVVPSALPEPEPIVPETPPAATVVEPAPVLPARPQPYAPPPSAPVAAAPDSEDEESAELPPGPRPYNSLLSEPAPALTGARPYVASGWVSEDAYESRVRTSALAAQNQRGPLDGSWLVTGVDGARLYGLQLSDDGRGAVEGAWRDANGLPGLRSGFIASVAREGATLTLRFFERSGTRPVVLTLQPGPDGRSWTGAVDRADGHRTISMRPQ